jgi:hypothetical protein
VTAHATMCKLLGMYDYCFLPPSGVGVGGGAILNSSGSFGSVPSPTCSHGERDSKLLRNIS